MTWDCREKLFRCAPAATPPPVTPLIVRIDQSEGQNQLRIGPAMVFRARAFKGRKPTCGIAIIDRNAE